MKLGDVFYSFDDLRFAIDEYQNRVGFEFWFRDARTINWQRKHYPETVRNVNEALKYYYCRLSCIMGGKMARWKNNPSKSLCPATIYIRISGCKQYLYVKEMNETHEHNVHNIARGDCQLSDETPQIEVVNLPYVTNEEAETIVKQETEDDSYKNFVLNTEEMSNYGREEPVTTTQLNRQQFAVGDNINNQKPLRRSKIIKKTACAKSLKISTLTTISQNVVKIRQAQERTAKAFEHIAKTQTEISQCQRKMTDYFEEMVLLLRNFVQNNVS